MYYCIILFNIYIYMFHKKYNIETYQYPVNIHSIILNISFKIVCLINNYSYGCNI